MAALLAPAEAEITTRGLGRPRHAAASDHSLAIGAIRHHFPSSLRLTRQGALLCCAGLQIVKREPASGKVTAPCLATVTVERNRRPPGLDLTGSRPAGRQGVSHERIFLRSGRRCSRDRPCARKRSRRRHCRGPEPRSLANGDRAVSKGSFERWSRSSTSRNSTAHPSWSRRCRAPRRQAADRHVGRPCRRPARAGGAGPFRTAWRAGPPPCAPRCCHSGLPEGSAASTMTTSSACLGLTVGRTLDYIRKVSGRARPSTRSIVDPETHLWCARPACAG